MTSRSNTAAPQPAVADALAACRRAYEQTLPGLEKRRLLATWRALKVAHDVLAADADDILPDALEHLSGVCSRFLRCQGFGDAPDRSELGRGALAQVTAEMLRSYALKRDPGTLVALQPLEWDPAFGAEEFARWAPCFARRLDDAIYARTGRPLVPCGRAQVGYDPRSEPEVWERLTKAFRSWRLRVLYADRVTDANFEELARAMLRALGATKDSVKNAFNVAYHRQTMADRRTGRAAA